MWKNLSFRTQLFLPLGLIFALTLIMASVLLQIFATGQFADENQPSLRAAKSVADGINAALKASANPEETLGALATAMDETSFIRFQSVNAAPSYEAPAPAGVPRWFVRLLNIPELHARYGIEIAGRRVGEVVFIPDLSADIYEKWIGFVAFSCFVLLLTVMTAAVAHAITGSALRPLDNLGSGLTRMRRGDYEQPIAVSGPPEIRRSCHEANQLARTLAQLSHDNRGLLRRLVSLQDDERRDLARELHDELGPLLFGIRANTIALTETVSHQARDAQTAAEAVLTSVETLQQANRRILDRLRPLYIQELGLQRTLQTLLQTFRSQAPQLKITAALDPVLDDVDGLLAQTVYRVIQEALTNVLRHAQATDAQVEARIEDGELVVQISDDGVGFPQRNIFGRGLTGMHERLRALSGSLELSRERGRSFVRCRMPLADIAAEIGEPVSR